MTILRIAAAVFDDLTSIALGFLWRGAVLALLIGLPVWWLI